MASRLSLNLSDLPEIIGVSPAMFYAYRSGKYKISGKAWHKLEQAERAAGMAPPLEERLSAARRVVSESPAGKEGRAMIAEAADDAFVQIASADWREFLALVLLAKPEDSAFRLSVIETAMRGFFLNAGGLADSAKKFLEQPEDIGAREDLLEMVEHVEEEVDQAEEVWRKFFKSVQRLSGQ